MYYSDEEEGLHKTLVGPKACDIVTLMWLDIR